MRMIRPKLIAPQVTIAEDQDEYKPLTAAVVRHPSYPAARVGFPDNTTGLPPGEHFAETNSVVLAFQPSAEERARIAAGEAIYVSLLTFNRPMQPIIVAVGPENMARWFGVEVEP